MIRVRSSLFSWISSLLVITGTTALGAPLLLNWGTLETTGAEQQRASKGLRAQAAPVPTQHLSIQGDSPWLIQFQDVVQEEWKSAVEATGAKLKGYIPENAFLVQATPAQLAAISARPEVVWVGEYLPNYKKAGSVRALLAAGSPTTRDYNVILFEPSHTETLRQRIESMPGVVILRAEPTTDRGLIRASLPSSVLDEISSWGEVEWIEPYLKPKKWNDVAVRGNKMNVTNAWNILGLTGAGQTIAVCDTGLDSGNTNTLHRDFTNRVRGFGWRSGAYSSANSWSDTDGHGTHVSGSVLGSGVSSTGRYRGVSYQAQLIIQGAGADLAGIPSDLNTLFRQAFTNGARIHSDSWGYDDAGYYNDDSRSLDMFVWSNKTMLILVAAGNSGIDSDSDGVIDLDSVGSPATAKNCLTVGASENYRTSGGYSTDRYGIDLWPTDYPAEPIRSDVPSSPDSPQGMAAFSSRGPCDDGRIKPDLVAPGTDIISTRSKSSADTGWGTVSGNTNYIYMGGTSMATPLTAGAAGLVRQWLVTAGGITNPSAALIKAIMMNGARNMAPGQYGTGSSQEIPNQRPNNVQGWGHVDIYNSLRPSTNLQVTLYDTNSLATGQSNQFAYTVSTATTNRFAITLAYSDYFATAGSSKRLINDLDLTLVKPSGAIVYANGNSTFDATNNVETIDFTPDELGTYQVRVRARTVPSGSQQAYALVVWAPRDDTPVAPAFGANPGPISTTTGVAVAFTVSASGNPIPTVALQSTTASSGYSFNPVNGLLSYTPPAGDLGNIPFVFTASNSVAVATQTVSVIVEPPPSNKPPVFVALADQAVVQGKTLSFTVQASDPIDGDPVTLSASSLPPLADFVPATGVFTWTNAGPVGVYTSRFFATDDDGSVTQQVVITCSSNQAPSLATIGAKSVFVSNSLQFAVTATDPIGDDLITLTASGLPVGATFGSTNGNGTFTWTQATPTGSYVVTFAAYDVAGTNSEAVTITVSEAPAFVTYAETFDLTTSWGGGVAGSYTAKSFTNNTTAPENDKFESNSSVRDTTESVTGNAWRLGNSGAANLYVRYSLTNPVTRFAMQLARWDNSPTPNFQIRYSLDSGGTYTTLLSTNGSWFSADTTYRTYDSGELNLVPASGQRIYIELYRTTGERMLMDNFEVDYVPAGGSPAQTPPTLTAIGAKSVTVSNALTFAVAATPTDGDTVTLTASNLPSGAVFGSTNEVGTFTWTLPTPAGVYTTAFYATDNDGVDSEQVVITVNPSGGGGGEAGVFTNILFQGFEAGDGWVISAGSGNASTATGSSDTPANQRIRSGSTSWQVSNASNVLDLASSSIAGFTGRQARVYVSCTSGTTGNGAEASDVVRVYAALNGAPVSSTPDLVLAGATVGNSRWGYTATNIMMTTAGTLVSNRAPQGGTSVTNYSTLLINLPESATSIALRVSAMNNNSDERWNIDDIAVVGYSVASAPPTGPGLSITTVNQTVSFAVTNIAVGGTSSNLSGEISWTNGLTGGAGTISAATGWLIAEVNLSVGTNIITVIGTNSMGSASGAVTITRESNDMDGDGLDDDWEQSNFGSTTNVSDTSDWDKDGFSDLHEFLAGTDPDDTNSLLKATGSTPAPEGGVVIQWLSGSNRSYTLSISTNLNEGFSGLISNIPATYPLNIYTVAPNGDASSVYRVELE